MSKNYNDNNIIIHDFTQKLSRFSKDNVFRVYHHQKNNSSIIRYLNNNKIQDKKNNYFIYNKSHFNISSDKNLHKTNQKYVFPSLSNNLLCENLFKRNSQNLPHLPKLKNKKEKKLYIFLSTSSFEHKKRDISVKSINSLKKTEHFFKNHNFNIGKAPSSTPQKYKFLNKNIKFKSQINKQNQEISKEKTAKSENNFYYYIIRPENCGYLVRYCFKHRKNWKELTNPDSKNFNFKWQQNNYGIDFNKLSINPNMKQMVNHFEYKSVISNKANMFLNMMEFSELQDINIFQYLPFTVLFDYNKVNFFNKILKFEYLFKNITNFLVPVYDINERKYKKNKERFYSYFFPFINKVGSKTPINIPETHFCTKKKNSNLTNNNNNNNNNNDSKLKSKIKNNFWLIKAPDLNRGRGIKILNNMIDIKRTIREFSMGIKLGYLNDEKINEEIYNDNDNDNVADNFFMNYDEDINYDINYGSNYSNNNSINDYTNLINLNFSLKKKDIDLISNSKDFSNKSNINSINSINSNNNNINNYNYRSNMIILQKYIENPLLYFGRKFDIRIWVLLTHELKIYVFEEGHLKCCSVNYELHSNDTFCHLTNYSFQKYNANFGKYELGNEASFIDLQKNIDINYNKKVNFKNDIFPKIVDIIKLSFESVKYKINPLNRKYTFEIFGFDFMLDYEFNPFLIEVNTNPGLEESSPLIKMLVPRMIDDALRLTVDKLFETEYDLGDNYKYTSIYESPFRVDGYRNSDNMFRFVCDLYQDPDCNVYRNYLSNSVYDNKQFFFRNNNNKI